MPKSEKLSVGLLFDDTLDSNDGVAQQVKRLGEWLSGQGHTVSYFCGETKLDNWAGGKVYSLSKNIRIKFNGNRLSMPLWSSGKKIKEALSTENVDVMHVMAPYSPLMAQRVIAKTERQNIPIVGSFHILPSGWRASVGARLLGLLQFFSLRKFAAFTSTSKSTAVFARRTMRINSQVVPNMIDIDHFAAARNTTKVPGRIVFLGRLVERKGCRQLIEAFKLVTQHILEAELVVGGDGQDRAMLEKLVSQLGLKDKVKFLGFIDETDKPALLASAMVACFPALYGESFGVVVIEAMAAGAGSVLAGDNPGYHCVMEDQPELLVDARQSALLANKLIDLLQNEPKRKTLHTWQLEHVKQYDVNVVAPQFLSVYAKAIAKRA